MVEENVTLFWLPRVHTSANRMHMHSKWMHTNKQIFKKTKINGTQECTSVMSELQRLRQEDNEVKRRRKKGRKKRS